MKSTRLALPDILKGIAVLLMIQVHIMELIATGKVMDSLAGKFSLFFGGAPAAPVFMAVMGYFLAQSNRSPKTNLMRGLRLIGLGFLLNAGMNFHLLIKIFTGSINLNPWPYLLGVDILFLAGLSIILLTIMRHFFEKTIRPYALLIIFAATASAWLPVYDGDHTWIKYAMAFFWSDAHWSYFPLFPWLAYPTAGFLFSILNDKFQLQHFTRKGLIYLTVAVFILIAIPLPYAIKTSTDLSSYYHHGIWFVCWALFFIVFWTILLALITNNKSRKSHFRYLAWIGKNVTAFYVIQWLIIGNVATAIYKSREGFELMLWFVLVLLFTSLLVRGWEVFMKKVIEVIN
jgi:uncharacterized membrane protein